MKKILVACEQDHIKPALQKSLDHLKKSCEIVVTSGGYDALDELGINIFDLIITNYHLSDVNGLDLAESIRYIDTEVPIILMIQDNTITSRILHRQIRTIKDPFKPLSFLRLVDRLLHHQLNRYRQLATALTNILDTVQTKTNTSCTFLVDGSEQILMSSGDTPDHIIQDLAHLAVTHNRPDVLPDEQSKSGLFTITVITNLQLVLLSPSPKKTNFIWRQLETAALDIIVAFHTYNHTLTPDQTFTQEQQFIPIEAELVENPEPLAMEKQTEVNWAFLNSGSPPDSTPLTDHQIPEDWNKSSETTMLKRLASYCQLD